MTRPTMDTMTLDEATELRAKQIQDNEDLGVIHYKSGEEQSEQVWEVTEGYKHLPGVGRIGPGSRFHPTKRQVERGSLRNKARELTRSEYKGLRRSQDPERKTTVAGADIGIRALPMAPSTLKLALDAGLTETDLLAEGPAGTNGQYTMKQVEAIIAMKSEPMAAETESEADAEEE